MGILGTHLYQMKDSNPEESKSNKNKSQSSQDSEYDVEYDEEYEVTELRSVNTQTRISIKPNQTWLKEPTETKKEEQTEIKYQDQKTQANITNMDASSQTKPNSTNVETQTPNLDKKDFWKNYEEDRQEEIKENIKAYKGESQTYQDKIFDEYYKKISHTSPKKEFSNPIENLNTKEEKKDHKEEARKWWKVMQDRWEYIKRLLKYFGLSDWWDNPTYLIERGNQRFIRIPSIEEVYKYKPTIPLFTIGFIWVILEIFWNLSNLINNSNTIFVYRRGILSPFIWMFSRFSNAPNTFGFRMRINSHHINSIIQRLWALIRRLRR